MVQFIIGDLLSGDRIQTLPVLAGSWSESINDAGEVSATVSLRSRVVQRLKLAQSAAVGKAFLAAVDGDTILQAGPIWDHAYDAEAQKLTLRGSGLLSYFDHRVLLPVLAGRLPSDPTTDTRFMPVQTDPDGRPWPTDTRLSLQGIMVSLFTQAMSWPGGNVPLVLPAIIPGDAERDYAGTDLASVWERARDLTQVVNGPEVRVTGQWTSDRLGIQWAAQIGTPTQPLIFSPQRVIFYWGVAKSSLSGRSVQVNGKKLASQGFASGGRSQDQALVSVSTNPALTAAGYPLLEVVDSSHSTVGQLSTLKEYSDEAVARGQTPVVTMSFSHDVSVQPYLGAFRAGDFAEVRVVDDPYLEARAYGMRILGRSGDATGKRVAIEFAPEVTL